MTMTNEFLFLGTEYHHAYTQTPQKPEKLPADRKNCRDTQTAEEREKIYVSEYKSYTNIRPQVKLLHCDNFIY